ncbi:MAG: DUF3592 domain-containing protein [Chloroflexi bacterium]|nr:DUF3592 domain-containing protein [Chloroflexota bacterium]
MEASNTENKAGSGWTGSLFLGLLGLAWLGFVAYTAFVSYQRWQLVTSGEITIGTVVAVTEIYDDENQSYSYRPTIQYEIDGQVFEFDGTDIGDPSEFLVGKRYEVLYESTNPSNGRLNFVWDIWFQPVIMSFFATVPPFLAVVFGVPRLWRKLRGNTTTI